MSLRSYSGLNGGNQLSTIAADMVSQFNARLTEELIRSGIPSQSRLRYLSDASGRAPQTAARWIDLKEPGMPDLRSFAGLCLLFSVDAHWLLGLTEHRVGLPVELLSKRITSQLEFDDLAPVDWMNTVIAKVRDRPPSRRVEVMHGHDMEPLICDGAIMFVDDSVQTVTVNGIYMLEYHDKILVRNVEQVVGDGFILRCENRKFSATKVNIASGAIAQLIKIIGKVTMAVNVNDVP